MSSSLPSPSMGSLLTATLPIEAYYTLQRSMPKNISSVASPSVCLTEGELRREKRKRI